jgi:hypothetical protein
MDRQATRLEATRLSAVNDVRSIEPSIVNGHKGVFKYNDTSKLPSTSKERRRRFPAMEDKPLLHVNGSYPRFDRFTFSPLSPVAFPKCTAEDWEGRAAILERYLDSKDSQVPTPRSSAEPPRTSVPVSPTFRPAALSPRPRWLTVAARESVLLSPELTEKFWAFVSLDDQPLCADASSRQSAIPVPSLPLPQSLDTKTVSSTVHCIGTGADGISIPPPAILSQFEQPSALQHFDDTCFSPESEIDGSIDTPPPALTSLQFSTSTPQPAVSSSSSPFDPPPAQCQDRFPMEVPARPLTSGPGPINTTLAPNTIKGDEVDTPVPPEQRFDAIDTLQDLPQAPTAHSFPLDFPPSPKWSRPAPDRYNHRKSYQHSEPRR